jgi:hypothetical protein
MNLWFINICELLHGKKMAKNYVSMCLTLYSFGWGSVTSKTFFRKIPHHYLPQSGRQGEIASPPKKENRNELIILL